jgi:pimeloyl-ACP methyl ester carboxylesterase
MKSSFTSNRREPPEGAVERFVQAGGTTIRYLEAGAEHSGLPLVMLHGYRAGADYWFPHPMPELARHHHVIAPDLPGFGYSGPLPDYNLPTYAAALSAFFDVLRLEKVDLLGHSFGSQVAIAAAATYPSRVDRLVLVDSAGLPRLEPQWQVPVKMLADASMRHFRIYPTILQLGARATAGREALRILQTEHVGNYLKSLTMPTLIIWGSRDRVVPLEHGGLLAKFIPRARLAVIRGAGHMPFYQKPEEFNRLVLAFLRRESEARNGRKMQPSPPSEGATTT